MATVLPPNRDDISGTDPNPSNAVARAAFGTLHDYFINLLGSAGTPAAARTALGAGAVGGSVFTSATNTAAENAMGVTRSLTSSGYRKTGDGLIIQWGSAVKATDAASAIAVTYPVTFPNACFSVLVSNGDVSASLASASTKGLFPAYFSATYCVGASGVGSGVYVRCNWVAFGY